MCVCVCRSMRGESMCVGGGVGAGLETGTHHLILFSRVQSCMADIA